MQLRPAAAGLFHADRRTGGHDEANSFFSQFCERAQNVYNLKVCHPRCVSTICNNKTIHHFPTLDYSKSK